MATTQAVARGAAEPRASTGLWREAWGRLRKNKLAVVGLIGVIILMFAGIFGPILAPFPYDFPDKVALKANGFKPLPPMTSGFLPDGTTAWHLLGTDQLGRDLFSRLLDGARISMTVALVVQFVVLFIGVPIGAMAGWFAGRVDSFLMRFTDVVYAFPDLLFIILLSVTLKDTPLGQAMDGLLLVFIAIGLTSWVTVARLVRGQMLSLKETEFVEAAKAIGVSDRNIVTRHLLPNGNGPVIVAITLGIPGAILAEATLAFIGIGVQPPRASWGYLVADGEKYIRSAPHLVLFPAICIAVALLSFTFLGDGLRDALDPKLKGKQ
jgi:oligopeptide transport system permease protein